MWLVEYWQAIDRQTLPHAWPFGGRGGSEAKKNGFLERKALNRAAKFTENKNDQWNHAGDFPISICAGLSLKMKPRNN